MKSLSLSVFVLVLCCGPSWAQNPVLDEEQATCLSENANAYLEHVDGPTLIFPGFCRDDNFNPTPQEVAQKSSQNSLGAGAFRFDLGDREVVVPKNPYAAMILLDGDQIDCIGRSLNDIKRTIRLDGIDQTFFELLLDRCGP